MIIGPKYKICKRLGASVFEKCQTQKFQIAEARAPRKTRRGSGSDYGSQLLEKQKARFTYGISETQFRRYVNEAMDKKGTDTTQTLLSRLESRLDNVVYRAGFAKTRRAARQVVSHGHIHVNGRRVTIPSYGVSAQDIVSIRPESRTSPLFGNTEEGKDHKAPLWMALGEELTVTISSQPTLSQTETSFDAAKTIQFYSR